MTSSIFSKHSFSVSNQLYQVLFYERFVVSEQLKHTYVRACIQWAALYIKFSGSVDVTRNPHLAVDNKCVGSLNG